MKPSGWYLVGGGVLFAAGLYYLSLQMAPPGTPTGVEHSAKAAEQACVEAVRDTLPEGQFPFSATASYQGEGQYRLNGIVDTPSAMGTFRRNYTCLIRYTESGTYRTDSLGLWQSH
jgi:hypothetical protein